MVAAVLLVICTCCITHASGLATLLLRTPLAAERPGLPKTGDFHGGQFTGIRTHANELPSLALLKTHKTGSSTLANILHRLGDRRNMSFMVPPDNIHLGWPSKFPGKGTVDKYGSPNHQFDIIANHAIFDSDGFRGYLKDKDPHFVAVVRDPMTQAISAKDYFHQKNTPWDDHLEWLERLNPITDDHSCSDDGVTTHKKTDKEQSCDVQIAHFLNPQAHDMGWHLFVKKAGAVGEGNSSLISKWLKTLDSELDPHRSIILAEHFNEGLALMKQKLGCDMEELSYLRMKVKKQHASLPSESQMAKLAKINAVDVALYEHLNSTFWKEWNDADQEALQADLAELERMNAKLVVACNEFDWDKKNCPQEFVTEEVKYGSFLKRRQQEWGMEVDHKLRKKKEKN